MKTKPRLAVLLPLILLLFATLFQSQSSILEQTGQYQAAYRWLPWRHDLLEKAGISAAANGDFAGAIPFLKQARLKNSLTVQGQNTLANAYWLTDQPDLALAEWESLYIGANYNTEQLLQMIHLYHQRGDFLREADVAQTGLRFAPDVAEFYWRLGLLKIAESPLEAIPLFEQMRTLNPPPGYRLDELLLTLDRALLADSPAYRLAISAQALASLGEWTLAQAALERAIEIDAAYAPAWALLGETRQQTGTGDALEALEHAGLLDPLSATTQAHLGLYWQRQNDFEKSSQYFLQAARLDQNNPIWLMNLGALAFQKGDVPLSYAYYQGAVEIAPKDASVWRALALFCLKTEGCLEQDGYPAALKARMLDLQDWRNADILGQVLMALGQDESARVIYARAISLAPQEPAPRFHLGLLYLRHGNAKSARLYLQEALDLDPKGALAENIRHVIERYLP